jgi:glutamate-5-semialdehyde dehydrogenase
VARGSGPAVATLGSLAQRAGVPVSLHGTGGAWICAGDSADATDFEQAVYDSLDRKVCNTLNTCCIVQSAAERLVPAFLRGMQRAADRREQSFKLHVASDSDAQLDSALFAKQVPVARAQGEVMEAQAQHIADDQLGHEWEWEDSPEVTLKVVRDTDHAIDLFNQHSPQFVASLLTSDESERSRFWQRINAPFVGDGFTRWVDGQFALNRPELGLSNWQNGRLFGRGGVLSGDSVFTVRTRVRRER